MSIRKVAIMTGGGDCPGLNAVIRGAVRVGKERYGWEILGVEDAFDGLVDPAHKSPRGNCWLRTSDVRGIIEQGGTILGTSNRSDPFNYVIRHEDGTKSIVDLSERVMRNFELLDLDALISIGGDGSMRIAQKFVDLGMNVVGVPKTIDNDLLATDQTFGFDTAVNVATECIDRIRDTAESHDRVMVVEVMGRHAGWIALHAGIAGGADVILLPEIPYRMEPIIRLIDSRRISGKHYSLVVVAEGAMPAGGEASIGETDLGGMPRLMGAAAKMTSLLEGRVEADVRVTVLGHIQRGGSPSSFDRVLATRYGVVAAQLVGEEKFGQMVALRGGKIVSVPISEAIAEPNLVDPEGQLVTHAREIGICFGQ